MLNVLNPLVQFNDENGNPLSLGRVLFYDAGTENPKNVYTDYAKTLPVAQVDLDAGGFMQSLFFGTGYYKVKIFKKNGSNYDLFAVRDNVEGFGSVITTDQTNRKVRYIEDADLLSTLDAVTLNIEYAYAYTYKTDSLGGGWFKWDPNSSEAEDLGFYFKYNSQALGRWVRVHDLDFIYPQLFGLNTADSLAIHNSAIEKALNYCYSKGKSLVIPSAGSGYYYLNTSIDFERAKTLTLEEGARFSYNGLGSIGLIMSCPTEIKGRKSIFNDVSKFSASKIHCERVRPEHFGAIGNDSSDCYYAFSYGSQIVRNPIFVLDAGDVYKVIATGVPSPSVNECRIECESDSNALNGKINLANNTKLNWFNISGVESNIQTQGVIFSNYLAGFNFTNKEAKISWFTSGTITATDLQNAWIAMGANAKMIWDIVVNVPAINVAESASIQNISGGGVINLTGNANLGIFSGSAQFFISLSSYYPILNQKKINPLWWGIDSTGINRAFACAVNNLGSYVDFEGASLSINSLIPNSGTLDIRNAVLSASTTSTALLGNTTSGAQSYTLKMQNCSLNGNLNLPTSGVIDFVNCAFSGASNSYAHEFSGSGVVSRCTFDSIPPKIYGGHTIQDSYFGGAAQLWNPSNSRLISNYFTQGVQFQTSSAGSTIYNLIAQLNTFDNSSNFTVSSSFADYGHKCEVVNNYSTSSTEIKSTQSVFDFTTDSHGSGVYYGYTFTAGSTQRASLIAKRFLPFAEDPIDCKVFVVDVPTGDSIDILDNFRAVYGYKADVAKWMILIHNLDSSANTAKLRLSVVWSNLKGAL